MSELPKPGPGRPHHSSYYEHGPLLTSKEFFFCVFWFSLGFFGAAFIDYLF